MAGQKGQGPDAPAGRRERGVIAQREYRKRHATKVQTLQEENTTLRNTIADIDRALRKQGHIGDELSNILANARRIAGLSVPEDNPEVSQQSETLSDVPQVQGQLQRPIPGPSPQDPFQAPQESLSFSHPPQPGHYAALSAKVGRLSPRLDYGLWSDTDRLVRLFDPPEDIVPYIGDGAKTLAGALFWTCMTRTIALWKDHSKARAADAASGTTTTATTSPAAVMLRRIFSPSTLLQDPAFLMSLALSRLDYKQKGYTFGRLQEQFQCNSTPDVAEIQRQAEDHHTAQGHPPSMWKTPDDVAAMIKSHLTEDETARMDAVLQGRGTNADATLLSVMIIALANHFVCFGDGPRWNVIYVHMALGGWLKLVHDPTLPRRWDTDTPSEGSPEAAPVPGQAPDQDPVSPPSPVAAAEGSGGATST
ncbi:hypothetical protein ACHAQA_008454 [Verticillium albo-atrum]